MGIAFLSTNSRSIRRHGELALPCGCRRVTARPRSSDDAAGSDAGGAPSEEVGVSRQDRQREEVISALIRRHYRRVLVLSREHLAEFPDDADVRIAAEHAQERYERDRASDEDA
jgi:hypothetical protein